jgi:hypothetical protein
MRWRWELDGLFSESEPLQETRAAVKRIESQDGTRHVEFLMGTHGLFRFLELILVNDEKDYEGEYWTPGEYSGLYDSLEAAERDARLTLPWLGDQISN